MISKDDFADDSSLRAENARLRALLAAHGIKAESTPPSLEGVSQTAVQLSTQEKVALFRRLFRGRSDIFPLRWEGRDGKTGYAPACSNEWVPGICEKPRIKCADCPHRAFVPVSDEVIYRHLAGKHTVGIYPLLPDDTCHFLAIDFDEADWRDDVSAFRRSCEDLGVPVSVEISRSGAGAHAWIFFAPAVRAETARRLGSAIISHACARTRQLSLASYDRLFPSQDVMPKGGFGNLIALPLQKSPRDRGCTVFVDAKLVPYPDQWAYLAAIKPMNPTEVEPAIFRATGAGHPLDVAFVSEEDLEEPWKRAPSPTSRIQGAIPERLTITLANQIYFEKAQLSQALTNRLIRLAAFQNPEFYRTQAMRRSVWKTPRVIGCAENFPKHIALPRGCFEAAQAVFAENSIRCEVRDERFAGSPVPVKFTGTLRPDQRAAVRDVLRHDVGVLCAPTAFGKTVAAVAIFAKRAVSTLVLVHRTELLRQWKERLQTFLDNGEELVGLIGAGKNRPTGKIDIAVIQSLSRGGEVDELVEQYGHVVVDECHHVSAISFEALLKQAKARYVLGLTATPIRRDGQQPVIFMQCGPIRHSAKSPSASPHTLEVRPRYLHTAVEFDEAVGVQDVFRQLAADGVRNTAIAADALTAYRSGRRVLVLTERSDHLRKLQERLTAEVPDLVVMHGRLGKKELRNAMVKLTELAPDAPRVVLATGRLIGEGFDHPPLDTLVLGLPISWRGTLQQYAGRLHREHDSKTDVRIYDYVDPHPITKRMWDKRQVGYRAMGYRIIDPGAGELPLVAKASHSAQGLTT